MLTIDEQCAVDYESMQGYHSTQQYQVDSAQREEAKKKIMALYDRLDSQWFVYAKVGFMLTSILGTCSTLCFLRVFGAGALAVSMALIVLLSGILLMVVFWAEIGRSSYKLDLFLCLVALSFGMALSLSDTAVDFTRHYWAMLQSVTILTGVSSLIVFSLILVGKNSLNQGDSDASN